MCTTTHGGNCACTTTHGGNHVCTSTHGGNHVCTTTHGGNCVCTTTHGDNCVCTTSTCTLTVYIYKATTHTSTVSESTTMGPWTWRCWIMKVRLYMIRAIHSTPTLLGSMKISARAALSLNSSRYVRMSLASSARPLRTLALSSWSPR